MRITAIRTRARVFAIASCLVVSAASACDKPLQHSAVVEVPAGMANGVGYVDVPADHRYAVEYVSGTIRLQTPDEFADFNVGVVVDGVRADFNLPVLPGYTHLDRKASGMVRFYADPGSRVGVSLVRGGEAAVATTGHFAISGCLLPVEAAVL